MQPDSVDTLLSGITSVSSHPSLAQPIKDLCTKFRKAFLLFGKCHNIYNGKAADEHTIAQFGMTKVVGYIFNAYLLSRCRP